MERLKGKVAIITEAASALGRLAADMFAFEGANLILCDPDAAAAKTVADNIVGKGGKAVSIVCDVEDPEDCAAVAEFANKIYGTIDVVFANIDYRGDMVHDICHIDPEDMNKTFNHNAVGTRNIYRAVIPTLVSEKKGSLVSLGSAFGECCGNTSYGVSKAAVRALTDGIAMELGRYDIRANTVCPGFTVEEVAGKSAEYIAELEDRTPMFELPQNKDIVNAVIFLASDLCTSVSAVNLLIDKGSMKGADVNKSPKRG